MRALAVAVVALGFAGTAGARVLTAERDVRACAVREGGGALAATAGGLVAVTADGVREGGWTELDGLPGTLLHVVAADGAGGWWVGGEAGLARVRVAGGKLEVVARAAGPAVRALAMHEGALWAGTWGGGVRRVGADGKLEVGEGRQRVTALASWQGRLYVGTAGQGLLVDGAPVDGVPAMVWALAVHDGALWAGTLEGLYRVGAGRQALGDVRALVVERGRLRAATFGDGVVLVDGKQTPGTGGARYVAALGVGCAGGPDGLTVGGKAAVLGALASGDVAAVVSDGPRVWIGSFDRGLYVIEADGRLRAFVDPAVDLRVNALALERKRVWVGTARGLTVIEAGRARRLGTGDGMPSADVHSLVALRGGGVLVGTAHGAARVSLTGDRVTVEVLGQKQGLELDAVWAVAQGAGGEWWIGTSRGLYRVEPRPGGRKAKWQRFSVGGGHLSDDWVTALAVSGDRVLVGSYAHGTVSLQADATAPGGWRAEVLGGPAHVNFGGLAMVRGRLLASSMEGLFERELGPLGVDWQPQLGTLGLDVTGVAPVKGGLWVAGRRGLVLLGAR